MQKPVPLFRPFARSRWRRLLLADFILIVVFAFQLGGARLTADPHPSLIDPAALDKWQVRFSSSSFIRRILSSPKGYVAVGVEGTILTSADGAVWNQQSLGRNAVLSGVAFGGGTFVVVGLGGTILTSTDGLTWTRRPSPTSSELYCVASSESGQFVASGSDGTVLGCGYLAEMARLRGSNQCPDGNGG